MGLLYPFFFFSLDWVPNMLFSIDIGGLVRLQFFFLRF